MISNRGPLFKGERGFGYTRTMREVPEKRPARTVLSAWLPVAAWLLVIVFTSSGLASEERMADALRSIAGVLDIELAGAVRESGERDFLFWTRKLAHLVEYAVLAGLVARALALSGLRRSLLVAALALVFAAGVAYLDESHQAVVPGRSSQLSDVGIDVAGALLGLTVWRLRWRRRPAPPPA